MMTKNCPACGKPAFPNEIGGCVHSESDHCGACCPMPGLRLVLKTVGDVHVEASGGSGAGAPSPTTSTADRAIYDFAQRAVRDGVQGIHVSVHRADGSQVNLFFDEHEARRLAVGLGRSFKEPLTI